MPPGSSAPRRRASLQWRICGSVRRPYTATTISRGARSRRGRSACTTRISRWDRAPNDGRVAPAPTARRHLPPGVGRAASTCARAAGALSRARRRASGGSQGEQAPPRRLPQALRGLERPDRHGGMVVPARAEGVSYRSPARAQQRGGRMALTQRRGLRAPRRDQARLQVQDGQTPSGNGHPPH